MALITLLTAEPGEGKTQAALVRIGRARAVVFTPTPLNKNAMLNRLPWVPAREVAALKPDEQRRFQEKHPQVRLILDHDEAHLLRSFMGPDWEGQTFLLDDLPQLVPQQADFRHVVAFIAGIRHRECSVIITTQRVAGVTPRYVRVIADEITQVGPLVAEDEARTLYVMGAGQKYPRFKDFYRAVSQNPRYGLFVIKGLDSKRKA